MWDWQRVFGSLRKMMGTEWDVMLVGWNEETTTI